MPASLAMPPVDLEAGLSHISNGGTELPNLGLNCVIFLLRWRFR